MDLIALLTTPNAQEAFANGLNPVVKLDDPRFGSFGGNELEDYYARFQRLVDGFEVNVETINSIKQQHCSVEEVEVHLLGKETTILLPVAVVRPDRSGFEHQNVLFERPNRPHTQGPVWHPHSQE